MKLITLLLIILFFSNTQAGEFRHFSEWTPKQKAEFLMFSGVSYIDYKQTTWAMSHRNDKGDRYFREMNPILGKYPSDQSITLLTLFGLGYYYYLIGSESQHPEFSIIGRTAIFSIKTAVILHNDSIGVSISKAW